MKKRITAFILLLSLCSAFIPVSAEKIISYPELSDPMVRSDEWLYGVWDKENEVWTTKPQINYSFSEELIATELAVKDGDYEKAAKNLLNYYRTRSYEYNPGPGSVRNALMINMWCDNILYWDENPVDVCEISTENKWYSVDVLTNIKSNFGTFMMFSRYKNDGTAQIYSKESEFSPYLELMVNGNKRIIYPCDDTMISAGLNQATSFGKEEVLLVADDADSGTEVWCDETTYRTYIRFPIRDAVDKDDEITRAKLHFYAQSDKEAKKIVVSSSNLQDIDENSFMWKKHIPATFCLGDYRGWLHTSNSVHSRFLQILYALNEYYYTEDEKYAYNSIRHVLDYSKSGKLKEEADLQVGIQLQKLAPAFVNFVRSPSMTPSAMNGYLKHMLMDGEFLYDDENFTYDMNFGSNATSGYHVYLACVPEMANYSLWLDKVRERETVLMKNLVQEDGSYIESDYGYATTSFWMFTSAHTHSIREGYQFPDWWYEKLEKFAYFFLNSETPNRRLPDWGDNGTGTVPDLTDLADMYDNPHFKYYATNGNKGKKPEYTSVYFPNNHVGIMRDRFMDENAVFSFVDNKQGGVHSHSEGIHFTIYAYGNYLLTDTGTTSYEKTHPHFYWQRFSTISHNSVDVNNGAADRKMTAEECDALSNDEMYMNKLFDTFEAESTAFAEATHNRDILFIKPLGMFICSDLMTPTATSENKYNQAWHTTANANLTLDETTKKTRTNFSGAANLQIVPLDAEELNLEHPLNGTTDVLSDGYAYFDNINIRNCIDAKFVNYEKYSDKKTTFDTVLYPNDAVDNTEVSAERLDTGLDRSEATAFCIRLANNQLVSEAYYMLNRNSENSFVQIPFGDFSSDGRMSYIEKDNDGKILSVMARDVSKIYYKGQLLLDLGNEKLSDISLTFNGSYIYIYSDAAEGKEIKLFKIADTDTIFVNDKEYTPNMKGNCYLIGIDSVVYDVNENDEGAPEVLSDYVLLQNDSMKLLVEHGTKLSGEGWDYTLTLPLAASETVDGIGSANTLTFGEELLSDKPVKLTLLNRYIDKLYYKTDSGYVLCDSESGISFENKNGKSEISMMKLSDIAYTTKSTGSSSGGSSSGGGSGSSSSLSSNGGIYATKTEEKQEDKEEDKIEETEEAEEMPADTQNAEFLDLFGHWAEGAVKKLYTLGIIRGRSENEYAPDETVTRAEFATMIKNALSLEAADYDEIFADVKEEDWFVSSVLAVFENGIMSGSDGVFRPFDAISREEACVSIVRAKESDGNMVEEADSAFSDKNEISPWAVSYVNKAVSAKLMSGNLDNTFKAKNNLTRAEAAIVILNLITE